MSKHIRCAFCVDTKLLITTTFGEEGGGGWGRLKPVNSILFNYLSSETNLICEVHGGFFSVVADLITVGPNERQRDKIIAGGYATDLINNFYLDISY